MAKTHPRYNDTGQLVMLKAPSTPTPLSYWDDPTAIARVVPDGPLPAELYGLALAPWQPVDGDPSVMLLDEVETRLRPASPQGTNKHCWRVTVPPLNIVPGKAPAAGAVVEELDGRLWVIHPSNAFGGYRATFPKGKQDPGLSLEQTAIKETFEETGLAITLTDWLIDIPRSTSLTRYFLARRIGGTPAAMGWESQAVSLVPRDRLGEVLHHPNDHPLLEALRDA